jgi:thiol-disulfide isomerase/thioredoxin
MKAMSLSCRIFLVSAGVFLFLMFNACSSNHKKSSQKAAHNEKALPHDPYSAPFQKASKRAKAPDFKTTLLDGKTFRLSNYRGDVVLLNIWATWCPPCREETPELVNLSKKYKNKDVEFLGVSIDKQGKSVVEPYVKKYHIPYPITIDDGHIMQKYGPVMGYPTTYIIDQQGNLRYFATGAVTGKEVKIRLNKLLNESSGG